VPASLAATVVTHEPPDGGVDGTVHSNGLAAPESPPESPPPSFAPELLPELLPLDDPAPLDEPAPLDDPLDPPEEPPDDPPELPPLEDPELELALPSGPGVPVLPPEELEHAPTTTRKPRPTPDRERTDFMSGELLSTAGTVGNH
jgi:hypothetical protein